MLAPVAWRVPPRHYGPWERVVGLLTEGLVARGVDVTLFATADSVTAGRLSAVVPRGYEEDPAIDAKVVEVTHLGHVFEHVGDLDLLHNHADFPPLTYTRLVSLPVVTTVHGFSSDAIVPVYERYADRVAYVSISDADRSPLLPYVATVHHGIDLSELTFSEPGDGPLVFLGRMHPDKAPHAAIEVARRAGRPLVMAGIVQDAAYFASAVEPSIDGDRVRFLGSVGPRDRDELLGSASALLHLIDFDEPFGLSMVEAMACGTPVLATRRGSVPEVVEDGVTGFVVEDVDEAVAACDRLHEISRAACRRRVEERFTVDRMVDDYLQVYEEVLAGPSDSRASRSAASSTAANRQP